MLSKAVNGWILSCSGRIKVLKLIYLILDYINSNNLKVELITLFHKLVDHHHSYLYIREWYHTKKIFNYRRNPKN